MPRTEPKEARQNVPRRRIYIPLAERRVRVGYEREGLAVHRSILGSGWTVCLGCGHRASPKGLRYWHARRLCDALSIIGRALHLDWSMGPGELKHMLDGMELTGPLAELTHGRIQRRVSARKIASEFLRKYRVFNNVPPRMM